MNDRPALKNVRLRTIEAIIIVDEGLNKLHSFHVATDCRSRNGEALAERIDVASHI